MLHYNRTDLSVGIDIVKSNNCKEYLLCHYWIFNYEFEFQSSACNRYHDLKMLCLNLSDIAISTVKRVDYCCIISHISKSDAIRLFENSMLDYRGYKLNEYQIHQ